jgi:hypothetical protein
MTHRLRALMSRLHPEVRKALELAAGDALSRTHYHLEIEHLMLSLLAPSQEMRRLTTHFDVDPDELQHRLRAVLDTFKRGNSRAPAFAPALLDLLASSWMAATLDLEAQQVTAGAILLGLADEHLVPVWRDSLPGLMRISPDKLQAWLKAASGAASGAAADPSARPPRVFLSYRRSDAEAMAQTLFWCLLNQVDGIALFRDSDTLQPGMAYADIIDQTIANCDVVLVLIGKKWLNAKHADGRLRLADADDLVRLEVASALRQGKKVFPCLLNGARMPKAEQLSPDLQPVTRLHATPISQASFDRDVKPLVDALQQLVAGAPVAG